MAILITGMSGFVGVALAENLLARGQQVIGFSRAALSSTALSASITDGSVIAIEGDIRDRNALEEAFEAAPIDAVVHCAVVTANLEREKRSAPEVVEVNIGGTALITHLAAERGVRRLVVVGSGSVYPDYVHPPYTVLDETVTHAPQSLYEISKSASEAVAARIAALHDLSLVIARLGQVFGPWERDTGSRDTLSPILQMTEAARAGRAVTVPRPYRKNWQYCRDAAQALATLTLTPTPSHIVYNIGPPVAWTLAQWGDLLKTRYPAFSYDLGSAQPEKQQIDLYSSRDTAFMSWGRYTDEFGPTANHTMESAFDDFIAWLDR